jgi:hypothetical protein
MSSLLDLPLEVLYAIAQFDSDLLALGGLLLSCKSMNGSSKTIYGCKKYFLIIPRKYWLLWRMSSIFIYLFKLSFFLKLFISAEIRSAMQLCLFCLC